MKLGLIGLIVLCSVSCAFGEKYYNLRARNEYSPIPSADSTFIDVGLPAMVPSLPKLFPSSKTIVDETQTSTKLSQLRSTSRLLYPPYNFEKLSQERVRESWEYSKK